MTSAPPGPYADFRALYDPVTSKLMAFALDGWEAKRISQWELQWFHDLIAGFTFEFGQWATAPPGPIRDYLTRLEQNDVSELFRQAGHVFLHVAYDLPRVIAATLDGRSHSDRMPLRSLFLRPAPLFREVFMEQTRIRIAGAWQVPLGFLKPAEILSYWLLSLRSVAWIHAETLADAGMLRDQLERQLAEGLNRALKTSLRAKGLARMPKLDNSTILQVSAPAVLMQEHSLAVAIASAVALLAVAGVSAFRFGNEARANRIAYFGSQVAIESARALGGPQEAPPSEQEMIALT